ncbi:nitrogen fixation protein NifM [Acerihabitans arboris]|uniref:peptidylprolyl isomerase n=1 Tax=Acerihabitans arboris TaxID=2691583 RepID=A0A845SK30_9GAMM|nr:nitrogen fixation protein NifM [Acerihabitans arboris]NDL62958.1 nitrogen fixation protein NifM [Acerihabitans arboris]
MEKWQIFSRVKLSLALYQTPPWLLSAEVLTQFEPRYARQLRLESRVVAQAQALGLRATENEIRAAVADLDQRLDHAVLQPRQLAEMGLDARGLYQAMTHEVLLDKMLEQVAQQAPQPSGAEVAQWYAAHQDKFTRPEQRECSHILLTVDEEQPGCRPDQAARRIGILHRRLRRDARDFAQLALRHSECPTALDGGNLGWIGRGLLYEALDNVLFSLPMGDISDVVTSPMGLHILYCRDIRPAAPIPAAEAMAAVEARLRAESRRLFQRRWLETLAQDGRFPPAER